MSDIGITVSGHGCTDVGRRREGNEDAVLVNNDLGLFAVCDGLGGHSSGEVASSMAIAALERIMEEEQETIEQLRSGARDSDAIHFIEETLYTVCAEVYELAMKKPEYAGMGTTTTVLLSLGERAVMGHVGDSRLYMVRDENMYLLSDDHTFATEMVQRGTLTPEEAVLSRQNHVLTRALGRLPIVPIDTLLFDVLPGDLLILCTDGLSNYLTDNYDFYELLDPEDPKSTAKSLVNFANACGGQDNISVIAVGVSQEHADDPSADRRAQVIANQVRMLTETAPFAYLPYRSLLRIARAVQTQKIPVGEELTSEGKHCDGYYLLLDGEVSISRGGRQLGRCSGCSAGMESMVEGLTSVSTVTAVTECTALFLPVMEIERMFKHYPRLGQRILKNIAAEFADRLRSRG